MSSLNTTASRSFSSQKFTNWVIDEEVAGAYKAMKTLSYLRIFEAVEFFFLIQEWNMTGHHRNLMRKDLCWLEASGTRGAGVWERQAADRPDRQGVLRPNHRRQAAFCHTGRRLQSRLPPQRQLQSQCRLPPPPSVLLPLLSSPHPPPFRHLMLPFPSPFISSWDIRTWIVSLLEFLSVYSIRILIHYLPQRTLWSNLSTSSIE